MPTKRSGCRVYRSLQIRRAGSLDRLQFALLRVASGARAFSARASRAPGTERAAATGDMSGRLFVSTAAMRRPNAGGEEDAMAARAAIAVLPCVVVFAAVGSTAVVSAASARFDVDRSPLIVPPIL